MGDRKTRRTTRLSALPALSGLLLLAAALLTALAGPAAAAQPGPGVGWIRLGHLSPQVPPVDIYLAPFGGPERLVIRKAGYGAVTPYSTLPPGAYTLSMRPAEAPPTSPPALTATTEITAGTAYSLLVFATGPDGALRGDLVIDDLTAPRPGHGRVRVVQGSAGLAPVSAATAGGQEIAGDVGYGVTTAYADLPQGRHPVTLRAGAAELASTVDVKPGSVTTLLVTEKEGGLAVTAIADSTGTAATPLLGVETGGGGAAAPGVPVAPLWTLVAVPLAAFLLRRRPARP